MNYRYILTLASTKSNRRSWGHMSGQGWSLPGLGVAPPRAATSPAPKIFSTRSPILAPPDLAPTYYSRAQVRDIVPLAEPCQTITPPQ